MDAEEYEEMLRSLVRIAAHQDTINTKHDALHERLVAAIERLDVTLEAIKDILRRGNGREA